MPNRRIELPDTVPECHKVILRDMVLAADTEPLGLWSRCLRGTEPRLGGSWGPSADAKRWMRGLAESAKAHPLDRDSIIPYCHIENDSLRMIAVDFA
jgi:hypothetical protein